MPLYVRSFDAPGIDPIEAALTGQLDHTTALRQWTVKTCVQRRIQCPDCLAVLDQHRATVLETSGKPKGISCNKCYTRNVDSWAIGLHNCSAETVRQTFEGIDVLQWDSQRPLSQDVIEAIQARQAQQ